VLVAIAAVAVEDLIPDTDALLEDPDEAGDVVELGLLQNTFLASPLVEDLATLL
jgi:hypothetical protein